MAGPIDILRAFIQAVSDGGGMDYPAPEMFNPTPQPAPSSVDDLFNQGQLDLLFRPGRSQPAPLATPAPESRVAPVMASPTPTPAPQSPQVKAAKAKPPVSPLEQRGNEEASSVEALLKALSGSRAAPEDTFVAKGGTVKSEANTPFSKGSFSKSSSNNASENYGFVDAKSLVSAGVPAGLAATIANQANDQKRKTGSSELSAILRQLLGSESQAAIQRPGAFGDQDKARLNLLANILQGQPMSKELVDILALATGMKDLSALAEGLPSLKRR